jgi:hypothetical protein
LERRRVVDGVQGVRRAFDELERRSDEARVVRAVAVLEPDGLRAERLEGRGRVRVEMCGERVGVDKVGEAAADVGVLQRVKELVPWRVVKVAAGETPSAIVAWRRERRSARTHVKSICRPRSRFV